jgi:hypothetical protein
MVAKFRPPFLHAARKSVSRFVILLNLLTDCNFL